MKNFYIAVSIKENNKYFAFVIKVSEHENLKNKLDDPRITHANIYPTKNKAEEVANFWNECYKNNNTYMF